MDDIVFSIAERTYPLFKDEAIGRAISSLDEKDLDWRPFGPDYAGTFTLRYPTLGDRAKINAMQSKSIRDAGFVDTSPSPEIWDQMYAFAAVAVLGVDHPDWFTEDMPGSDADQRAVLEVGIAIKEHLAIKKKQS